MDHHPVQRRQLLLLRHLSPSHSSAVAVDVDVEELTIAAAQAELQSMIGQPVSALDTPALFVDLEALESNIAQMSAQVKETGAVWRPHTKAIRSPALARMLVDGGAVGVTCAKVSQAAVLVRGGVKDVLLANEIVGPQKVSAMVALSKLCDRLTCACDNEENLRAISAEAVAQQAQMSVLIDLNVGMNRCGIHFSKKDEIVMMAKLAMELPNLEFRGLMGYDGHAQGNTDIRTSQTQDSSDRLFAAKGWVVDAGLEVPLLSGCISH